MQQVREYAAQKGLEDAAALEAGLTEKAQDFARAGAIYVPKSDGQERLSW